MMNNINNVQRKSLDYQTPYQLFKQEYGERISILFHLKYINPDEINLSYKLLNKQFMKKKTIDKIITTNCIQFLK